MERFETRGERSGLTLEGIAEQLWGSILSLIAKTALKPFQLMPTLTSSYQPLLRLACQSYRTEYFNLFGTGLISGELGDEVKFKIFLSD